MSTGSVTAIMAKRNGFGECHIEPKRPRHRDSNLGHFECVRETSPLVVLGKHEDLCFACEAAKGRCMENPVAVALKAGTKCVGLFGDPAITCAK